MHCDITRSVANLEMTCNSMAKKTETNKNIIITVSFRSSTAKDEKQSEQANLMRFTHQIGKNGKFHFIKKCSFSATRCHTPSYPIIYSTI